MTLRVPRHQPRRVWCGWGPSPCSVLLLGGCVTPLGWGSRLRCRLKRGGRGDRGDSPPAPHVWEHCDQADHAESRQSTAHPTMHRLLVCKGFSRWSCGRRRKHRCQAPQGPRPPRRRWALGQDTENWQRRRRDANVAAYREFS